MKQFTLVLFLTTSLFAALYVSPSAEPNGEGSEQSPFSAFESLFESLNNGDTVYLMEGVYDQPFQFDQSVTADSGVAVIAQDGAVFGGFSYDGIGMNEGMVVVRGKVDITLRGLEITNVSGYGIEVQQCQGITIEECSLFNTFSSGILCWFSQNATIRNNDLKATCNGGASGSIYPNDYNASIGVQECISISNTKQFLVENNRVSVSYAASQGAEGIDIKCSSSDGVVRNNVVDSIATVGIYIDGYNGELTDVIVENNRVEQCNSGIIVATENGGSVSHVTIRNNLVSRHHMLGIAVEGGNWTQDRPDDISSVFIVHNSVVLGADPTYEWTEGITINADSGDIDSIYVFNNLLVENHFSQLAASTGAQPQIGVTLFAGNNLCYGGVYPVNGSFPHVLTNPFDVTESYLNEGHTEQVFYGDPLWATAEDLRGHGRNQNNPAIGCFESDETAVAATMTQRSSLNLYRNGTAVELSGLPEGTVTLSLVTFSGRIITQWKSHSREGRATIDLSSLALQPCLLDIRGEQFREVVRVE